MKTKFCALVVGASLLTLVSAGNATQPLSDSQMDGITAGIGQWTSAASAAAAAFGNFDAVTFTATNTFASQVENAAIGQSQAIGEAASAVTRSLIAVGSNAAAVCIGC